MNNMLFGLCLMFMVSHWAFVEDLQPAQSGASVEESESRLAAWSRARASADFSGSVLIVRGEDIILECRLQFARDYY